MIGALRAKVVSVSILGVEAPMLALWMALGFGLSEVTTRITDWFVMTDELVYERLAISIGTTLSPLPRIHGVSIRNLEQLYPLLIAAVFRHGLVPGDLISAHLINAWVMSSACIPAFLLARRVTARRWPAYVVGLLTVAMPWLIYAPFLLTEVAAYPALVWALLGLHCAIVKPSSRNDLLAVLGIGLAFFARTEFVLLAAVLPIALVAYELGSTREATTAERLRKVVDRHRLLAGLYVFGAVAVIVVAATGSGLRSFSVYGQVIHGSLFWPGEVGFFAGHAADLSLGLGILPFVVGTAWMLANVVRSSTEEGRAFACVGTTVIVLIVLEATTYDHAIGEPALDRFLFYLVPVVILGFLCALTDQRRPRWSLLAPVGVVVTGFITHLQPTFDWSVGIPLNSDTPIAVLYHPIAVIAGGRAGASAALAIVTIVLAALFVLGASRLRPRRFTVLLVALVLLALPGETVFMFHRLLDQSGYSYRPLTAPMNGVLDWLDEKVGTNADATLVPYSVSSDVFVTERYWRDFEFWNKSARRDAYYPNGDPYAWIGLYFPKTILAFDPATGSVNVSPSRYVVQAVTESRFRISGPTLVETPEVMVIAADQPWRLDWMSVGLYDDGWTRPGVTARIRIFSAPDQRGRVIRTLTLQIRAPYGTQSQNRPYTVISNAGRASGKASNSFSSFARVEVCVPAHGFSDVRVSTPDQSTIPGGLSSISSSTIPRQGGIDLADVALADEIGGSCKVTP